MIPSIGQGPVHLLGIGGTAMASLAGLLKEKGIDVTGSDQNVYPPMSDLLEKLKVEARTPYRAENIPREAKLVVVGNALSRGNTELEAVLRSGVPYTSMAEVLKEVFLRDRLPIVIAGTHGKTMTSSLLAWLLTSAGRQPGFLVGGIPLATGLSFRVGEGEAFVVEGDEYDTAYFDKGPKFMHYLPRVAVLLNVEFDHADIYRDVEDVEHAFRLFVNLVPQNGLLVVGSESERAAAIAETAPCPVTSFAVSGDADWTAEVRSSDSDGSRFLVRHGGGKALDVRGPFWGAAALRNVLATIAVADHLDLSADEIQTALSSFEGVKRRFEIVGEERGVTVVDDFAHHPTAVRETLSGARFRFADRKIWAIFEPRSFTTRSNVFQAELAEALGLADAVIVSEVFRSARLPKEQELSEEQLIADLRAGGADAHFEAGADPIVGHLSRECAEGDVVIIMSNGGFGGLQGKLLRALSGEEGTAV